jgi:hypothetical protein
MLGWNAVARLRAPVEQIVGIGDDIADAVGMLREIAVGVVNVAVSLAQCVSPGGQPVPAVVGGFLRCRASRK